MGEAGDGSGAMSGAGGEGGAGDPGESCTGCARFSVPLTGQNQTAHYIIGVNNAATDFTGAIVTATVFVHAADGGAIQLFLQTSNFSFNAHEWRFLNGLNGWVDIIWNLGADNTPAGYNYADVTTIGVEITRANSASWTNPTIVYVDEITVDNGVSDIAGPFTFDNASTISTAVTGSGAGIMWLNGYDRPVGCNQTGPVACPGDDTGSNLTWLGP